LAEYDMIASSTL